MMTVFSGVANQPNPLLAADPHLLSRGIGVIGVILIAAVAIGYLLFFVAALLSVLAAPVGCFGKIVWFIVILCLPFLGSLLWFIAGRPRD